MPRGPETRPLDNPEVPVPHMNTNEAQIRRHRQLLLAVVLAILMAWAPTDARADLSFNGKNRFILNGVRTAITVINEGNAPVLAEVSLDWGDAKKTADDMPLAISSPLVKIAPRQRDAVHVFYQGAGLPQDRESYFLLNVLDVPANAGGMNQIQIALRHRFKLFYRPRLKTTPDDAMRTLAWQTSPSPGAVAVVENPSPLYVTLSHIQAYDSASRACGMPVNHLMVAPFSTAPAPSAGCVPASLRYSIVTDAGDLRPFTVTLSPDAKNQATPEPQFHDEN